MKSAETRSTWLWSEFRVVVPGTVLSIWITSHSLSVLFYARATSLPQESTWSSQYSGDVLLNTSWYIWDLKEIGRGNSRGYAARQTIQNGWYAFPAHNISRNPGFKTPLFIGVFGGWENEQQLGHSWWFSLSTAASCSHESMNPTRLVAGGAW